MIDAAGVQFFVIISGVAWGACGCVHGGEQHAAYVDPSLEAHRILYGQCMEFIQREGLGLGVAFGLS